MLTVRALVLDGLITFDLACVIQAFRRGPGPEGEPDGFTLETCAVRPGQVDTCDGFKLEVELGVEALYDADIVVVPGRHPHDAPLPAVALRALRDAHARGATIIGLCVGAFVLAHAGLLDGRPATTHWAYCDDLAREFPAIDVRPGELFVDDGSVLTSAGIVAALDLCLHVVRREHGAAAAARLAAWNVVALHREGGQAQFIPPDADREPVGEVGPTLLWARQRLNEPLTVAAMARHACMSERTFSRRFHAEVGVPPKQWLFAQRVQLARELLETTDNPVEQVAASVGFGSPAALRKHLHRHVATTPTAYRRAYRAQPEPG